MSFDATSSSLRIAIVGTGAMGRGIAQIAAQAGITVLMFDALEGAAAKARDALGKTFDTLRQKGRRKDEAVDAAMQRLQPVERIAQLADAALVIEAIVEDLDVKRALFRDLETVVGPDCVLATNTSSLSVTAIAAGCARPQRVVGFHFFNPVPLMKVVEVIDGVRGAPEVGDAMILLARRMGHEPVRAKDTPGFIVNHAGRGYGTEALRLLGENVAAAHVIDAVLREQAGFGPFELLDLTGLTSGAGDGVDLSPVLRTRAIGPRRSLAAPRRRAAREEPARATPTAARCQSQTEAPAARPASVWSATRPALAERARSCSRSSA
jgi:3-hydroxybutyryl-CoA dehydrogenase